MLIAETILDGPLAREVIFDTEARSLYLALRFEDGKTLVRFEGTEPLVKLSAYLEAELGYGPARDLLERNAVPHDSPLWDLNHNNPWKPWR